jgi:ATP-binding cassette, subfamily B, bacterial MsbA
MSERSKSSRKGEGSAKPSSFQYFKRLLGYVWPQKRYIYPALGFIILVAITYSASIGSILPVLYVMIQPDGLGLHGRANQYVAEHRFDCELGIYSSLSDREITGVPDGTLRIRTLKQHSPLYKAGLRQEDFVLSLGDGRQPALTVLHDLAKAGGDIPVIFQHGDGRSVETRQVSAPHLEFKYHALQSALSWIPSGQLPRDRMITLAVVLGGLLILVVVENIARLCAEYLTAIAMGRGIIDLRRQMYTHMFNLPLSHFSQNTTDTTSKYMQDMNDIIRGLENFFQKVVTEPFKAVGVTVLAFYLNWQLTLAILLGVPAVVLLFRKLGKTVRRANKKLLYGYGEMLSVLESTLIGLRVVKGYMRENYERRRLFKLDRRLLRQRLRIAFVEALTPPLVETLGFVAGVVAILFIAHNMFYRGMKPPELMTMLICLVGLFDPIRKLSTVYAKIQQANAAAERVFALIDSPSEYEGDAGRPRLKKATNGTIEFEGVGFRYENSNRDAVRDFTLTVKRGEVVALVGPNGSGKTTLVSLLPRFFPMTHGRILIDGQDITKVSLRSLREQFCLITQESVIFPDTVRANIAYGRPNATNAEIEDAATKAFADEFIRQMPDGYETMVGEHGATLSGGQRQRIAIARAILRNAPILIFDEATSQVDPESERKIHQALEAFIHDRTAFVIAHRYSTVSDADRIVVMDDAQLVDSGKHSKLLSSCPLYRRLYETQFRDPIEAQAETDKHERELVADNEQELIS